MSQHFLLSTKARTLSLAQVMRLTDDEAFKMFTVIRWAANGGEPICERCGGVVIYKYESRRILTNAKRAARNSARPRTRFSPAANFPFATFSVPSRSSRTARRAIARFNSAAISTCNIGRLSFWRTKFARAWLLSQTQLCFQARWKLTARILAVTSSQRITKKIARTVVLLNIKRASGNVLW